MLTQPVDLRVLRNSYVTHPERRTRRAAGLHPDMRAGTHDGTPDANGKRTRPARSLHTLPRVSVANEVQSAQGRSSRILAGGRTDNPERTHLPGGRQPDQ